MSIYDHYGHPTIDMFARPAYYLLAGMRVQLSADNTEWRENLEAIGAVEVSREDYERADALREDRAA